MQRWCRPFDVAEKKLSAMGIEVFNASTNSALKCFPRKSVEDFIAISRSHDDEREGLGRDRPQNGRELQQALAVSSDGVR
jgi:hypothetical protein